MIGIAVGLPSITIFPQDILDKIERNDVSWEGMVPPTVAEMIKAKGLFRYQAEPRVPTAGTADDHEARHES